MGRRQRTQTDLAAVLHMTQAGVSKKVRGLTPFSIDETYALAEYFGVPVAALLLVDPGTLPPAGPLAQSAELRTFNPLTAVADTADVVDIDTFRDTRAYHITRHRNPKSTGRCRVSRSSTVAV